MVYSINTRSQTRDATYLYLPDECWEHIFKIILNDDDTNNDNNNHRYFKSFSVVSKQFLSITNRLRFSLTICDPTQPFLRRLFERFTNLTSLDLTRFKGNLDELLTHISTLPLNLKSLKISNQYITPRNGLLNFSEKNTTLTSLNCPNMNDFHSGNLVLISNCFPLLEELDLSNPVYVEQVSLCNNGIKLLSSALLKLRKVNLSRHLFIDDESILHLFKTCKLLEEVIIIDCYQLTIDGIAYALRERPTLRCLSFSNTVRHQANVKNITSHFIDSLVSLKGLSSLDLFNFNISDEMLSSIAMEGLPLRRIVLQNCADYSFPGIFSLLSKCRCLQHVDLQKANFLNDQHIVDLSSFLSYLVSINLNHCSMLTNLSLFSLVKNCPSLSEIKMEYTSIGTKSVENSISLMDFVAKPQLKSLYLTHNSCLRDESIIMFASIFPNLELLDLRSCKNIREGICQVLRKCCKLRHLILAHCSGVRLLGLNFDVSKLEVLKLSHTMVDDKTLYMISKNCCGLLQLSLRNCSEVTEKGVKHVFEMCTQLREINLEYCYKVNAKVVDSVIRPSLRKITHFSDRKRKLFRSHGCHVVW